MVLTETKDLNELRSAVNKGGLSVLEFMSPFCGHCRRIAPLVEELVNKHAQVQFLQVDVSESPELAREYDVQGTPTFLFYKDGKEVTRLVGPPPDELKRTLQSLVTQAPQATE